MADLASARIQEAINQMIEGIDKSCVRKMQGDMHRCAARCCDNDGSSMQEVHRCIESCSKNIVEAQTFLQNELTNYQNRVERCVMQCEDGIKDRVNLRTTEAEAGALQKDFEHCVIKCADTHVKLVPSMQKRIKEFFRDRFQVHS